jgi:antitoxin component YwqK of YwqJK toxin-antitoxin module
MKLTKIIGYNDDGSKSCEYYINKNNKEEGTVYAYNKDGTLRTSKEYKNGMVHGKSTFYYPNHPNKRWMECNNKMNVTNGNFKAWRINGTIKINKYFINGASWRNKKYNIKGWNKLEQLIKKKKERRMNNNLENIRNRISKLDSGTYSIITSFLTWDEKMKMLKDYKTRITKNKRYRKNWLIRSYQKRLKI